MRRVVVIPLSFIFAMAIAWLLGGCSVDENPSNSTIRGTVLLPAQQVAQTSRTGFLARLRGLFISDLQADVVGLAPVANATVELVRLDSQGNVIAVIATTTSDASGNYSFTTTEPPSSDLAVRLPNEPAPTRAIVTQTSIDITPVSEAVVRSIIGEILNTGTVLGNYAVSEVKALVDLVNGMDIDLSTAADFEQAVGIVRTEAGSILTDMVTGYSPPGASTALASKNFIVAGQTTTLVPPPQLTATGTGGIDHRIINGAFGFRSTGLLAASALGQISLILSDLSTATYFCDVGPSFGVSFIPASNGQVTVTAGDGSGSVAGALATDGTFMVYPGTGFDAAVGGQATGFGLGLHVAAQRGTKTPVTDANRNPLLLGNYNFIWSATHMDPTVGTNGALTILTGRTVVNYDGNGTPDIEGRNAFTDNGSATIESLTLDIAAGTVTSATTVDTVSGVYEVLPQNHVLSQMGDPATLMGGGGGSADFLQGLHLSPATNETIAPLAAFSSYLTAGNMGQGGGMNMGTSNCGGGTGNTVGGGGAMMGSNNGEGRGLALAAPVSLATGLTVNDVSGTYNAVAQLNSLRQGAGTAFMETEIDYGTFSFNPVDSTLTGTLRYKRSTLDTAAALAGNTAAVTNSSGNTTYTGTYSVGSVDGTVTLTLTGGFTTGTGFIARKGDFLVLPIQNTDASGGSRGLLLLMRQP